TKISGSFLATAMVIAPCSMHSLAGVAQGITDNLLLRSADVMLKEGKPLILVPREAPLNKIHVGNMLKAIDAGAKLVPAAPAFYHRPQTVQDLVDFVVGKVLDSLGIEHTLFRRWGT
ncbi:MAG: UbiX family flavin prenyltransferase, partial [Peptococcaceae bacterium]|nr:UbiX family flavin prenyltransferase [Peptococcaceae bacterium]